MTLLYLQKVKLIEVNEECDQYFLPEVVENTEKESESAARVRKHRSNLKALQCNTAVTDGNALVTGGNKSVTTEMEKREKSSERDSRYQISLYRQFRPSIVQKNSSGLTVSVK